MKYRKGMSDYYGKHGMSMLGMMEVAYEVQADGVAGFLYHFYDFVVQGYNAQDVVQVPGCLQIIMAELKRHWPEVTEVALQSNNAGCFESQQLIPFIYNMNKRQEAAKICVWLYTEAQTGRGRLDTHFSYVNTMLQAFVENGNDIDLESDIVRAM